MSNPVNTEKSVGGSGYGNSGSEKGLGMPGWVPVPGGEEGEMEGGGEEEVWRRP